MRATLPGSANAASPPASDELEISLFGPGYGESLVLHLGAGQWMIVDSCVDARSGEAAALGYLRDIGVDCARDVRIVLATHWHDDHVRGIADAVQACQGARFICSSAFNTSEFLVLTNSTVLGAERTTSGVREFGEVLSIVRARRAAGDANAGPKFVLENTVIHQSESCEVRALSPSSASIERAMAAIASMLPERRRPHLRVRSPSPNEGSVALWMKGPSGAALLGADVERQATNDRGWGAILALSPAAGGRARLVKVPHHGGESAHDARMWDDLLEGQPAAMLTPWSRGAQALPSDDDRHRLCNLAPGTTVAGRGSASPDRYEPAVERTLREVVESRRTATGRLGHVRARSGPADAGAWRVDLIRDAAPLCAAA